MRGGVQRGIAWYWRGDGVAETVTDEGWTKFNAALSGARADLEKSYALYQNDPESAFQMLWVCIGLDAPRDEFEKYFKRVTDLVPAHLTAHLAKQQYLLPKWHGTWEETDAFMSECADRAHDYDFPMLVTVRFVGYQEMYYDRPGYRGVFERKEVADELLRRFSALVDSSPHQNLARANYARVLYRFDRYEDALAEFETLGDNYYIGSLWDSVVFYNACRAFTYYHRGMRDPFRKGEKDLERAAELGVAYGGAYQQLAINCLAKQDYAGAEAFCKQAIEVDPEYAPSWVTLNSIYRMQKRKDEQRALAEASKQYEFDEATRQHFAKIR